METIVSIKVAPSQLLLVDLIDFYFICERSLQNIYLYHKGKACKMSRMTELLTFILTTKEKELLVIIEGIDAKQTKKYLYSRLSEAAPIVPFKERQSIKKGILSI
ncbi:hypothetical protein EV207_105103 [Scopulibacillus darangshiensis]|uniref:Uncharacterized protein n=1 Tax=Scopulibacillus darangshiensis TaxID=442528 RepID=A0A4R2P8K2_9BACL|nr:hypothetical protein [Scopulibacillus darangshiensis]TCP30574.1 hypothetical protein EV207_105103 [Scopulibacillus darangshiensis]